MTSYAFLGFGTLKTRTCGAKNPRIRCAYHTLRLPQSCVSRKISPIDLLGSSRCLRLAHSDSPIDLCGLFYVYVKLRALDQAWRGVNGHLEPSSLRRRHTFPPKLATKPGWLTSFFCYASCAFVDKGVSFLPRPPSSGSVCSRFHLHQSFYSRGNSSTPSCEFRWD